ncbi:hypothetical protein LP421_22075 [Rhizobium sp. RCAM05350]|nr:hypothetical protein LP421_22075 [Rhizobium sp. RCAM05350]
MDDYLKTNLLNWDDRAALHATDTTGRYRIDRVLSGGSSLHALEAGEIGDIAGKDIVHLQCHIGLDTLSLKHLGALGYRARFLADRDNRRAGFRREGRDGGNLRRGLDL